MRIFLTPSKVTWSHYMYMYYIKNKYIIYMWDSYMYVLICHIILNIILNIILLSGILSPTVYTMPMVRA